MDAASMGAAAMDAVTATAAVGVEDLDSLLPGRSFTERVIDYFFRWLTGNVLEERV